MVEDGERSPLNFCIEFKNLT